MDHRNSANTKRASLAAPALMRPSEVAEQLNVTIATLESWRSRGGPLPFVRLSGRAVRYRQSDVDAFIAQNTVVQPRAAA